MSFVRSAGHTLDVSARFLAGSLTGRVDDLGQQLLMRWARQMMGEAQCTVSSALTADQVTRPFVVMSNHASLLDIPAMLLAFPKPLRMVAKEELMRIPIWGRAMRGSGFIPIARRDTRKAIEQLQDARRRLEAGVSIWIAPEGTRRTDGRVGPFKKGGFHLARDAGLDIMPAYIDGSHRIMPRGRLTAVAGQNIEVRFGAPVSTAGRDLEELIDAVRGAILQLEAERDPPMSAGDDAR